MRSRTVLPISAILLSLSAMVFWEDICSFIGYLFDSEMTPDQILALWFAGSIPILLMTSIAAGDGSLEGDNLGAVLFIVWLVIFTFPIAVFFIMGFSILFLVFNIKDEDEINTSTEGGA